MNPFAAYARSDKQIFPGFPDFEDQRESTTFFGDFTVAEPFGIEAVKDTFKRCMESWKDSYKYLTELVMVLNHKGWMWYEKDKESEFAKFYFSAFEEAKSYGYDHLKGDELRFFDRVLD